jgi:[ribosomal protein S18]-alanine N-acetyltransferase
MNPDLLLCQENNVGKNTRLSKIYLMSKNDEARNTTEQPHPSAKILRLAKESDLPAVVAIEQTSFPLPWTEAAFRSELSNSCSWLWVVEERSIVTGYVCVWFIHDEGQIVNVAVLPEYRRNGLGKVLLCHVLQEAITRGICALSLEVRRSNRAAIELYKNFGFQEVTIRERYYENGEDALLMVCDVACAKSSCQNFSV